MSPRTPEHESPRIAVVGGGLAGLAAAAALAERGLGVELFEARRRLGGRAGSYRDPASGELIDHGQHVSMGCCTNLADLCRRTGVADCFRRRHKLHFIGPRGSRHVFTAAPLLPAPLHLTPSLLRLGYLGLADRLGILWRGWRLAAGAGVSRSAPVTIDQWLRARNVSDTAIERFWSVVLTSALGETPDRASAAAARKVFLDGLMASRRAYEVEVPRVPLGEIYDRRMAAWLRAKGVHLHTGTRVRQVEGDVRGATGLLLADVSRREFDLFVAAVPWRGVRGLLAPEMLAALPGLEQVERIEPAPITAVHLWLDRPVTRLPDAVLVGRTGQWLFNRGRQALGPEGGDLAYYYQVVISASYALRGRDRSGVVDEVHRELAAIWPEARRAKLLRWQMVTEPEAVFSCGPGVEKLRPAQRTPIANLALAGDWTATGWPATMEGAVRSGYLAAESILKTLGRPERILVPDLPRARLARWLFGTEPVVS